MKRPSFTIVRSDGARFDANHIAGHVRYDGTAFALGVITFFCSGNPITLPVAQIKAIEFNPEGAAYCSECDKPYDNGPGRVYPFGSVTGNSPNESTE